MSGYSDSRSFGGEEAAQARMQAIIAEESQRAVIQQAIAKLTKSCWDRCIGTPGSSMSSKEKDCLMNCTGRYLDTR